MATAVCSSCVSQQPAQGIKIQRKMSMLQHFSSFTPAMGGAFLASRVWASAATQWGKGHQLLFESNIIA